MCADIATNGSTGGGSARSCITTPSSTPTSAQTQGSSNATKTFVDSVEELKGFAEERRAVLLSVTEGR